MNKFSLNLSILVSAALLVCFHYFAKPKLSETDVEEIAHDMSSSIQWRGQIAPDFDIQTTEKKQFRLSDNVGKKMIVLNFFATWCQPCRSEMPELNEYFNNHKAESFLLVGIDAEEDLDRVDAFLHELKINFPVGIDTGPIEKRYGVTAFPTTVVIGVDGRIQFYEAGALANADVAFSNLLQANLDLLKVGRVISGDDYRVQAQKHPALPPVQSGTTADSAQPKLSPRAQHILARMDCPCGCDSKVNQCTCNTSKQIQKALATEDFGNKSDDEIIKALNKRFCPGAM
jgi:peroxiredoxin